MSYNDYPSDLSSIECSYLHGNRSDKLKSRSNEHCESESKTNSYNHHRKKNNLFRVIRKEHFLDTFRIKLREADTELLYILENNDYSDYKYLTVFAPTNKAFKNIGITPTEEEEEVITTNVAANTTTQTVVVAEDGMGGAEATTRTVSDTRIITMPGTNNGDVTRTMTKTIRINTTNGNKVPKRTVASIRGNGTMSIRTQPVLEDPMQLLIPEVQLTPQQIALTETLKYHIIPDFLTTEKFINNATYETLRKGTFLRTNVYSGPKFRNVFTVNGAEIVESNIKASNGVLQVIDRVLTPPRPDMTIWLMIKEMEEFSILRAAIEATHLVPLFNNTCALLTAFLPTNEAFEKLAVKVGVFPSTLIGFLLERPEYLESILKYHVLDDVIFTPAFKYGLTKKIETVEGTNISIKNKYKCNPEIYVIDKLCRRAKITKANMFPINGAVHVIDEVLLPSTQ